VPTGAAASEPAKFFRFEAVKSAAIDKANIAVATLVSLGPCCFAQP
jgi:hypothetical protein